MTPPVKAILIGAGERGAEIYGKYALAHPDSIQITAVAEPDTRRREIFARKHKIPADQQFMSWEPLLEHPKLGQAALICTGDQQHVQPAIEALRCGYDVLLEKPMATSIHECGLLVRTAEFYQRHLMIAHVLRYTQHFQKMRQIVLSGQLGQVINVDHRENVSWWHMSHSYVRGNWRRRDESAPMILAKCSHDFDILTWVLNRNCTSLSSTGGLLHYRQENAPVGAARRCLDGCQVFDSCPYYAPFIYLDLAPLWRTVADTSSGFVRFAARAQEHAPWLIKALRPFVPALRSISPYRGWPLTVLTPDPTRENVLQALKEGPYGGCVYYCDNDVVDHQVVNMEFAGGISVTLTMHGHSHIEHRTTRIEGSRATLTADFGSGGSWIEVNEHLSDSCQRYETGSIDSGHGGGDSALMDAFIYSLTGGEEDQNLTTAKQSIESHLLAFAAEEARLQGTVIDMEEFRSRI